MLLSEYPSSDRDTTSRVVFEVGDTMYNIVHGPDWEAKELKRED